MSDRYKVFDDWQAHFVTCTVVGWADALSRPEYKEVILDSLRFCQQRKGLRIYAWVIMANHLHMIVSAATGHKLPDIMRDFKKFTSRTMIDAISNNPSESRREWMLSMFGYAGRSNNDNEIFQFWKGDYHPVTLDTPELFEQRLTYLHENPVRAGIVWEPQDYKYSSAVVYYEQQKGLLDIIIL